MDFVVVDVETANFDLASICQVGIAAFSNGVLEDTYKTLVNPVDYFSPVHFSIHGIDDYAVKDAPVWTDVFPSVREILEGKVAVCHTHFDCASLNLASERNGLHLIQCQWLDSSRVVRETWPQFAKAGYGLPNLAAHFGIEYGAHDALEDARCAGLILLKAIAESGTSLEDWVECVEMPLHTGKSKQWPSPVKREGNPEGRLHGEVLVFTGEMSISRVIAADAAAAAGCRVDSGITKHTTMVVIGDEEIRKSEQQDKSLKHRKAEAYIAKGIPIRIIGESDFKRIVALH